MATERDFELLDDYLANRMDVAERASFEQRLQADPDLQSEYTLQQNLVSGLKKARMTELKAMLQNVPVPVPAKGGASVGAKFALGAFTAALIATGLYFYVTQEDPKPETVQHADTATEEKVIPQDQTDVAKPEQEQQAEAEVEPEATREQKATDDAKKLPKHSPAKQPVIDVFDPSEEAEESAETGDESPKAAERTEESHIPAEVVKSKNYSFHYQFKDEKLFLYGPFEDGPYEILEFFKDESGKDRTVFLYFKDKFYMLEQTDTKIKPLNPITDITLISKLKEYRNK